MLACFELEDEVYQRLLEDKLSPSEEHHVTDHIEGCIDCQSKLEAIAEADIDWDDVRRSLRQEDKTTCRDAGSITATSEAIRDHADRLGFLGASNEAGSLGRFGRYEIREILGSGGMGVVMRGYDLALDRQSAIKVLAPELATNAAARSRFSREAKSAAAVVHEHVVPIQTVDEENGLPYLVMPVIEGNSLEQRVGQSGPLETREVLRIGKQIAAGLAAAHRQGLVHRDVKPANILLENGVERVMITDFGLARAVDDANMTQSGVVAGTPQYMSPEQARGNDVDHRSDLFSLGSVLYFMCTGRPPFRAETTMGVLNRIANDTPRAVQAVNSDVPPWLQGIIDRLHEKDPDQRFQSAAKVADVLGQWLAHVQQPDVSPKPTSTGAQTRMPKKGKRSPWTPACYAGAAVVGGLLLVMAAVVVILEWNKGTIMIECPRPGVPVRIMKGDQVYEQLTVKPSQNTVRVGAGQYVIEIEGKHDGLTVEGGVVTVTRGTTQLVKITQSDGPMGDPLTSTAGTFPAPKPDIDKTESPAALSMRVLELLQGTWIAANKVGAGSLDSVDDTDRVSLTIENTEFIIGLLDAQGNVRTQFHGMLTVSARKTPWRIQALFQPARPPLTSLFGEFHVDAEQLEITWTAVNNPREFIGPVPASWVFVRGSTKSDAATARRDVSVSSAVREFNELMSQLNPNHGQPPLSEEEVVAAVRWALRSQKKDFSQRQLEGLEVLIREQRLPDGWEFIHSSRIGPGPDDVFECWLIILKFPKGSHIIRRRMLKQPYKYEDIAEPARVADDEIPLAAAIHQFNGSHGNGPIGTDQPPLSEEEVVAAIRWWKNRRHETAVTNGEFDVFQQIADTRSLPKGFEFELQQTFEPGDAYTYVIWSVRLKMQRTAKPDWTYAFDLRERFISSRLINDGTIRWGPVATNGLQAGVKFTPSPEELAAGRKMAVQFFIRNTTNKSLELSLPKLMPRAYYDEIHAVDSNGELIPITQDEGPSRPVGWLQMRLEPNAVHSVNGLPILLGSGQLDSLVETAIHAEAGWTSISFTLPNFGDEDGEPLKTGAQVFEVD